MTDADHFMRHKTKTYREAVCALQRLVREEGLDVATRASAEATCSAARSDFIRSERLRLVPGWHVCYHNLLEEECLGDESRTGICDSPTCIPGADHLSEWTGQGKTRVIVSQPYHLSYEMVQETIKFCDAHGLRADLAASPSWHFPGRVLTVMYRRNRIAQES